MTQELVILDTNVVLDWLVFEDPACRHIDSRLESGLWLWIASDGMRAELERVLRYPAIEKRLQDAGAVLRQWDLWARPVPEAGPCAMQCSDRDDQRFLDLAIERRARWLLSRDRALLRLARRAQTWGVQIMTPTDAQVEAAWPGRDAWPTAEANSLR
jgi:predicted nucleic acid-binding protein